MPSRAQLKPIEYEGELLVIVTAESEGAAAEGLSKIKIEYELLDVFTREEDLEAAEKANRTARAGGKVVTQQEPGDDDDEDEFVEKEIERLLKESKHVVEGYYGIDADHALLPGNARDDRRMDGRQAPGPSLHAECFRLRRPVCAQTSTSRPTM